MTTLAGAKAERLPKSDTVCSGLLSGLWCYFFRGFQCSDRFNSYSVAIARSAHLKKTGAFKGSGWKNSIYANNGSVCNPVERLVSFAKGSAEASGKLMFVGDGVMP